METRGTEALEKVSIICQKYVNNTKFVLFIKKKIV
jgi:hypothetical protein